MRAKAQKVLDHLLSHTWLWYWGALGLGVIGANDLPVSDYWDAVKASSGIGFTMLGFGITATSILASMTGNSAVKNILQRYYSIWKDLSRSFARASLVFLAYGLVSLIFKERWLGSSDLFSTLMRLAYMTLTLWMIISVVAVIYGLHRVVTLPPMVETPVATSPSKSISFPDLSIRRDSKPPIDVISGN